MPIYFLYALKLRFENKVLLHGAESQWWPTSRKTWTFKTSQNSSPRQTVHKHMSQYWFPQDPAEESGLVFLITPLLFP